MDTNELQRLKEYERKARELRRQETKFWKDVESRKKEIYTKLELEDFYWDALGRHFGKDKNEIKKIILSDNLKNKIDTIL